ncbi:MAG: hypothetical protein NTY86_08415, partial [Deltaproteobacteria bacterium]|nr:hypothetical protein [Deltaproteobacteria bacterium]
EGFTSNLFVGLFGILLSPGRSIFVYSPILALAIPGAWLFYKKEKLLALSIVLTVLAYIIVVASWHDWDGGWTWGSRLLTPIVPLLGFLIAPVLRAAKGKKVEMVLILTLATLGLLVQCLAIARSPIATLVESVFSGNVKYYETLISIDHSFIALQLRSLQNWQWCDLDAYTLRQWLACP